MDMPKVISLPGQGQPVFSSQSRRRIFSQPSGVFLAIALLFAFFLAIPMLEIVRYAFSDGNGFSLKAVQTVLIRKNFFRGMENSLRISAGSAAISTILAFLLAYGCHFTTLPRSLKKAVSFIAVLPMLLPTITYGFALIYSFGRQGLLTRLAGRQFFDAYGTNGMVLGFVIYTLPAAFLLLDSTMYYIDQKYFVISRLMGDSSLRRFLNTVLIPLLGTAATAFIQGFTLSFTDYGIPASIAGNTPLAATLLYDEMMGSLPNFATGSVIALAMLVPSVVNILLIRYLGRFNIRYTTVSPEQVEPDRLRDFLVGGLSLLVLGGILAVFAVIFVVPVVSEWPYDLRLTTGHFLKVFTDGALSQIVVNSLGVSLLTAFFGTLLIYGAALLSGRDTGSAGQSWFVDTMALLVNTIPGMVLGVAYLLAFRGTDLQNTFLLLILCNIVHLFPAPYLLMKNALEKMNGDWEKTAALMGDSWFQTVCRIITPNALLPLLETFSYYFINAMVTVSAVVFIAGARTMVMTVKIKELQHFANFNEIFVLSILIFGFNLLLKGLIYWLEKWKLARQAD